MIELSVVSTLYHSASHLGEFYDRMVKAVSQITENYEIVLVDDGSPDHSLEIAISLSKRDPRVKVIELSRNFGHHRAIMTGLSHCEGKLVFLIDCDLEEDPELLGRFHLELVESGSDVVYGVQQSRKGGFFERLSGAVYYRLINILSDTPIPTNLVTVRLMTKNYVEALIQHRERELSLGGIFALTGFRQKTLIINKHSRGHSTYSLRLKIGRAINSVTAFSNKPLFMICYIGLIISVLSFLSALYLVLRKLLFSNYLIGWSSLVVSLWLLGGFIIFSVGVIGIYLGKIFIETKQRPYTIVRAVYGDVEGRENTRNV